MSEFEKNVTFVIVCFRSRNIIEKCLESISSNCKVIIVENSNDILIKDYLEKKFSNVQVLISGDNIGYGRANNLGISMVKTKYVFILNPDTYLEKNTLKELSYVTNVLNWRPPGNRSPLVPEIELSLPFIRRHIELVKPRVIFLMGGVACKAILGSDLAIGKMRGKTHIVKWDDFECPSMVSFHPSFLIRSPLKKKEAWEDLLLLQKTFLQ
jgi:uracil-DNA glycosylase family 4